MTIEYTVEEKDYLTHQLFVASKSERIRKKRRNYRSIVPLMYVAFMLYSVYEGEYLATILFLIMAVVWFLLYPYWDRWRYRTHYRAFVKEHHKDGYDETVTLTLNDDHIAAKSEGSEGTVQWTEAQEICEIPTTIFIRFNGGQSLILPKDKLPDLDLVTQRLKELAGRWKIPYEVDEKWEWR